MTVNSIELYSFIDHYLMVRGIKKLKLKVVFLIKFEIKFIPLYGSYMQGQDPAYSALP